MQKFYLGVDMGTNSVGIACTDETYKLIRAKGKDLWAVRLFDEAQTASERRVARTTRRRTARRKYRIEMLQALMAPFIDDSTFFLRMEQSSYYLSDKDERILSKYTLFCDETYTDKDFYKEFPTIYHLRKCLIEGKRKYDLRLYYLALHHIVKYRGHFLAEGSVSDINDPKRLFNVLNNTLADTFEEDVPYFDADLSEKFQRIIFGTKGVKNCRKELLQLFGVTSPRGKEIVSWIAGGKANLKILFGERYAEEKNFAMFDLSDENFEALRETYGDDFSVLEAIRAICNYISFEKILDGNEYISDSMVGLYEKHKNDLRLLKSYFKAEIGQKEYNIFFKSTGKGANYTNYIGYTRVGKKFVNVEKCSYDDFLKNIRKILEKKMGDPVADKIIEECEEKTFLPKILNADNGLFTYQINQVELNKILANMVRDYPETSEIAEKIPKLFTFRIPYYVGPLNVHGEHSWIVKRSNEKITPWNFEEVVDLAASNEAFMLRMTNKCSYLHGKNVLPKCSMLYQKFDVLNQINKLRIDEQPISIELKQGLFNDLFMQNAKVSVRQIRNYLVEKGYCTIADVKNVLISGVDGEIKATMSSYVRLKKILGDLVDERPDVCENIILWHTLNTDKNVVVDLIKRNYGDISQLVEKFNQLKNINYFKDFGRLSKEFLTELYSGADAVTGEVHTIIDLLYDTNDNLNEILYEPRYGFLQAIERVNWGEEEFNEQELIDELYVSPAVRRGIRQTMKLIDEYVSVLGRVPDKIFLEVTREHKDDGRTESRKSRLLNLYKGLSRDAEDIKELLEELNKKNDADLRSERLYLYFRQLGRCMYSGKKITLNELFGDTYDVDHILPRAYTKDDSLTNKALVLRSYNANKTDIYPLPQGFSTQQPFWKLLMEKGLIEKETYKRLTRVEPLNENDYREFVNRQKTITDQTVKAVAELLNRKYAETGCQIVYSKAKYVSDFKQKYGFVKCRETNDLHHARDAYMNIVVGNVYHVEFNEKFFFRNKNNEQREKTMRYLFNYSIDGAWDKETSLSLVKSTYQKTSMAVTRLSYVNKGSFYKKMTILPKGDKTLPPLKGKGPLSDPYKYGGHMATQFAYQTIIETEKKGKIRKFIYAIPVLTALQEKQKTGAIEKYLTDELHLKDPKILVRVLKQNSLVKINGFPFWTAGGGTKDPRLLYHNALQWFTSSSTDFYIKAILKLLKRVEDKTEAPDKEEYPINENRFNQNKGVICKENNMKLYDEIQKQLEKDIYQKTVSFMSAFGAVLQVVKDSRASFEQLSTIDQCGVLIELVKYLKADSAKVDLTRLGNSTTGLLRCNNDITDLDFVLVDQSPCGLTVRERKI